MRYKDAKKLHHGDEVTIKETGRVEMVLGVEHRIGRKEIVLLCEDGYEYLHTEVQ